MSVEENKAIVKKWEDALHSRDEQTIVNTAQDVFAPKFTKNHEAFTARQYGEHIAPITKMFPTGWHSLYVGEGDYVVSVQQWPFRYKDKSWEVNATRLVCSKIQNGKIVEHKATQDFEQLKKFADDGKLA